ncbi:TPA: hypothetical protein NDT40_005453, partial [Klebsiella oxytoca]|nr:hypothetical protein [Klebsiella oxytoca]
DVLTDRDTVSDSGDYTGDVRGAPFVDQANDIAFHLETHKILFHFKAVYQKMKLRMAAGRVSG